MLVKTLLLATSHSCNLLIYCLSSLRFRQVLYKKLLRVKSRSRDSTNHSNDNLTLFIPPTRHSSKNRVDCPGEMSRNDKDTQTPNGTNRKNLKAVRSNHKKIFPLHHHLSKTKSLNFTDTGNARKFPTKSRLSRRKSSI